MKTILILLVFISYSFCMNYKYEWNKNTDTGFVCRVIINCGYNEYFTTGDEDFLLQKFNSECKYQFDKIKIHSSIVFTNRTGESNGILSVVVLKCYVYTNETKERIVFMNNFIHITDSLRMILGKNYIDCVSRSGRYSDSECRYYLNKCEEFDNIIENNVSELDRLYPNLRELIKQKGKTNAKFNNR